MREKEEVKNIAEFQKKDAQRSHMLFVTRYIYDIMEEFTQ